MSSQVTGVPNVTVGHIVGYKTTGDLGIELEVEGTRPLPQINEGPWRTKGDESLRGHGAEYYNPRPILCDSTKLSIIKQITDPLANTQGVVQDSPRTSLHVHVNVLGHTPVQFWTAAFTYFLLENLLIKFCGEDQREGNLFCLTLKTAEGIVRYIADDLRKMTPFDTLHGDNIRYASQNLNAVTKFGSIEYRGMRGVTDPNIIDTWSTEMYHIVHRSKRWDHPEHMLDTYLNRGDTEFLNMLFSPAFINTLVGYKNWNSLIKENLGVLSELCYIHDWDKWSRRINKNCKEAGLLDRTRWANQPADVPPAVPRRDGLQFAVGAAPGNVDVFWRAQRDGRVARIPVDGN